MIYSDEMIRKSRAELHAFVRFFNQKIGYEPIIIGGWAVDYYNPYYGSKDIDVVFPVKKERYDPILKHYFKAEGHELVSKDLLGTVKTYRKICADADGRPYYIDIDACDIGDKNTFHTNPDRELPYSLVTRHNSRVGVDGLTYKIPSIELLLSYKLKAYSDRNHDMAKSTSAEDISYYASKRDKDGSDIVALLDERNCRQKTDPSKFREIISVYGIQDELDEALKDVAANPSSHSLYPKIDGKTIKHIVHNFRKHP
jgi:hypothetical protein